MTQENADIWSERCKEFGLDSSLVFIQGGASTLLRTRQPARVEAVRRCRRQDGQGERVFARNSRRHLGLVARRSGELRERGTPYLQQIDCYPRLNWRRPNRHEREENLIRNTISRRFGEKIRAERREAQRQALGIESLDGKAV